jgi:hypothetical protein
MKKYFAGLLVVMLAVSTAAFTGKESLSNVYYWYDADNLTLMSGTPSALPPGNCILDNDIVCAYGHSDPTGDPENNWELRAFKP